MRAVALLDTPWRDPFAVLSALADRPWTIGFMSGGAQGRWSYVATDPDATLTTAPGDRGDPFAAVTALIGSGEVRPDGPPFQGGVAGLASYQLGRRVEAVDFGAFEAWPDLACARYTALLAFDHARQRLTAVGRGGDSAQAEARARSALLWLGEAPRVDPGWAVDLRPDDPRTYERAVAATVARITRGELFQANLARRWRACLPSGAHPIDLLTRLAAASPAPFAGYLRLPGLALVSNSPERFLRVRRERERLLASSDPIKGTAPRGATVEDDARLAAELQASPKDRAENLMIVDLMRNDLARACRPGTVKAAALQALASFANVHHLVSRVTGELREGAGAMDLLRGAFPPGSITGAPKVQAMKLIAEYEAPRGPFFGAMFQLGCDGTLDSNVLIRTAACAETSRGWRLEARAGAGIVADSDPLAERQETEAKISALAAAAARRPS